MHSQFVLFSMPKRVMCGFLRCVIFSRGFLLLTGDFISEEYGLPDRGTLQKMFRSLIFNISFW